MWCDFISLEQSYASRILTVDSETTHAWGEVAAVCEAKGRTLPPQDGLIAASALRHGLHLMTRNVKDFEGNWRASRQPVGGVTQ